MTDSISRSRRQFSIETSVDGSRARFVCVAAEQMPIRLVEVLSLFRRSLTASRTLFLRLKANATVHAVPALTSITSVSAPERVLDTRENSSGSVGPSACHSKCCARNAGWPSQSSEPQASIAMLTTSDHRRRKVFLRNRISPLPTPGAGALPPLQTLHDAVR